MLENGVFNRPYVRDITKICECACSMNCDKNATELRPDRNPDIITNADRIRSMSDEELAEFISRIEIGDFGPQVYGKTFCDMCKGQYECDDCRLWWLQQPAEEDT